MSGLTSVATSKDNHRAASSSSRHDDTYYKYLLNPAPGNDKLAQRLETAGYVVIRQSEPVSLKYQVEEDEADPREGQVHGYMLYYIYKF
ncbi:hypothetical protein FRC03_002779 [Tulasnella sp. 419]|nr:hypothetical protein FRC03_002779 [Tulasnella sp. 419]